MLSKQEGNVPATDQAEVGRESFPEGRERVRQPARPGGELFGPGVGGSEKQKTSRPNQPGENLLQKFFWISHPIQQVGAENKIERSERREPQGIPSPKTDASPDLAGGSQRPDGPSQSALLL